jgi:hypothetical protein
MCSNVNEAFPERQKNVFRRLEKSSFFLPKLTFNTASRISFGALDLCDSLKDSKNIH